MMPEQAMALGVGFARELPEQARWSVEADWPDDWPEPAVVAWMLAIMLARVMPSASFGFARPK